MEEAKVWPLEAFATDDRVESFTRITFHRAGSDPGAVRSNEVRTV